MLTAIIIDDEEDARESLRLSLQQFCPQLQILKVCDGPLEGVAAIKAHAPNLVFLDVQMPHMSGFDLLESLDEIHFQVIFVTAHDRYAIKAIRFSALDYLLKPVDIEELVAAVNRATTNTQGQDLSPVLHNVRNRLGQEGKLAVPINDGMIFVDIQQIIYCQAEGAYTRLMLAGRAPLLVSKRLKEFENILDPNYYCRVHHSSIINLNQVDRYVQGEGGYVLMSNQDQVSISRRKKEEFMRLIARL
ncbi:MAG: LytTR family DNA-binding domain-containing protein [Bacteroidota bacterium]